MKLGGSLGNVPQKLKTTYFVPLFSLGHSEYVPASAIINSLLLKMYYFGYLSA
jgi:hypothetical protein